MTKDDLGKFILRLSLGGLMLFHGIDKIFNGIGGVEGLLQSHNLPSFFAYGVYIGEVLAPIMLIIGFKVRIAATLQAFTMLVAIYTVTNFNVFSINEMGGWVVESQMLFLLPCIALIVMGGGKYGISLGARS